jgi:hypothetical protein
LLTPKLVLLCSPRDRHKSITCPGTADPLHNKEATARVILDIGGDYLIGTKEKTPNGWTSGAEPSPHHPRHRRAA